MSNPAAWPQAYGLSRHDSIDSTNEEARRLAAAGAPGPVWIVARRQTGGRGRRGRSWTSPPGNLYATLLIRPNAPVETCAQLSFAAALAVGETLAAYAPAADIALKWPNDVLIGGRKASGILLESAGGSAAASVDWLAVGVGVNLAHYPPDTEFPATSLAAALDCAPSQAPEPDDALARLAVRWAAWYDIWAMEGFGPLKNAWLARAAGLGRPLRARLAREEITGVFDGLDESGALILRRPGGATIRVSAGEVFFPA